MMKQWITVDRKGITFHGRLGRIVTSTTNLLPIIMLIAIIVQTVQGHIQSAILMSCSLILFLLLFKKDGDKNE